MTDTLTQTHLEAVITAAIDAEMQQRHFIKAGDSYSFVKSEYEVISVPGPGGGSTGNVEVGRETIGSDGTSMPVTINPSADVYGPWRERIESAFKGWKDLPDPSSFTTLHGNLDTGSAHLAGGGGSSAGTSTAGNVDLVASVGTIATELAPYAGQTVDTFQRTYVSRMGPTFANQSLVGSVLTIAAKAEADLWTEANANIIKLATDAKTAFENANFSGGGGDTALTVLGILAAAAGLVASGGTAAPAIAAGGTVIGIIKDASSLAPKDQTRTSLAGGSASEVYESLVAAISKLSTDISQEETSSANMMWRTYETIIGSERANYDLSRPTELFGETDINKINKTDLDTETLKNIGNVDMPAVASGLRGAATELDLGSASIWDREAGIGNGYNGPYHEASVLSNQLIDFLTVTGQEVEDAGEILVIAANNLDNTDSAASTALEGHRDEIAEEPTYHGRPTRDGGWILPSGKPLPAF